VLRDEAQLPLGEQLSFARMACAREQPFEYRSHASAFFNTKQHARMATLKAQRATAIETSCSKYGIFIAAWSSVFHLDSNRN
jgi:hypothetical protein